MDRLRTISVYDYQAYDLAGGRKMERETYRNIYEHSYSNPNTNVKSKTNNTIIILVYQTIQLTTVPVTNLALRTRYPLGLNKKK